jgi:hypothetical protein
LADSQKPVGFARVNRFAALCPLSDWSGFAGSIEGLLEILRAAFRYIPEDLYSAATCPSPEYFAKHSDESFLQGKAAGAEAVSIARQTDTSCSLV